MKSEDRRHSDIPSHEGDLRNVFEHDRDRILYSAAFRRLAGVAQVSAVREQHLLHNRLTHSLKVAQIGRRLAQRLVQEYEPSGSDEPLPSQIEFLPDVVEAAGLAHDIGHPPFGHPVEEVLDERLSKCGGFEGNAQTFRVVTKLAVHSGRYDGLNLTRETLNGILKYPSSRDDANRDTGAEWHDRLYGQKWGFYASERADFSWARDSASGEGNGANGGRKRSSAAVLMDWADDISYVTHDIYDYFRAGLMPLHALDDDKGKFLGFAHREMEGKRGYSESKLQEAYEEIYNLAPRRAWGDTRTDRVLLHQFLSKLITRFMNAATWDGNFSTVTVKEDEQYEAELLKLLTFFYVIRKPILALTQEGQKKIITELFDELYKIQQSSGDDKRGSAKWPILLQEIYEGMGKAKNCGEVGYWYSDDERVRRAVCDYICSLTEDQAYDLYSRLTGHGVSHGSMFGAWFN